MANFTYNGGSHAFPNNSGLFMALTTALNGSGTESNGILLQYRPTKSKQRYRDASTVVFMGRDKPATETGQYNFQGLTFQFSFPDSNNPNYDGGSPFSGASIESRIDAILDGLQTGKYVRVQDSRGRDYSGTFTSDPVITDELVGWRTVAATVVQVGTG